MLTQARQRRLEGVDVVIGVVETHGRIETELLTKGFEVIPRKRVPIEGMCLREMDIDAILQRRPKLVLVDELAHTNAPGSRHPKRYLDVEELLDAGIDVYTTLNIQHVESLNDVVAQITHVRVRETVPDSIIDRANEVELVDLTPGRSDPAAEGGKGLRPRAGGARDPQLFHARQSDGLARTGAAPHRPARRRADGRLHACARHRRARGRPGERVLVVHQRGPRRAGAGALCAAPGRPAARALDRDLCRDAARTAASAKPSATASPRRCAWPSDWAARR